MIGYIYFLTNIAIPGLIKIGHTTNSLEERLSQLNSTGVPAPFHVAASFQVENPSQIEKIIHKKLNKHRYNKNREFFEISIKNAMSETVGEIIEVLHEGSFCNGIFLEKQVNELFDDETLSILKTLAGSRRKTGYFVTDLKEINDESEIEATNRLANLKEAGLAEEKRSRDGWQFQTWHITTKGIKYIFDNDLVEEYMKDDFSLNR